MSAQENLESNPGFTVKDKRVFEREDSDIESVFKQPEVEESYESSAEDGRQEKLMEEMVKAIESQSEEIKALRRAIEEMRGGVGDDSSTEVVEADPGDYSDLYKKDSKGHGHRPDGKFLSKHEQELIESNADLIRGNLPEHEEENDGSEFKYQPGVEPEVELSEPSRIDITQEPSSEQEIDVKSSAVEVEQPEASQYSGRFLTDHEKSNYEEFAAKLKAEAEEKERAEAEAEAQAQAQAKAEAEAEAEAQAAAELAAEEEAARQERVAEEQRTEEAVGEVTRRWYHKGGGRDLFSPTYWGAKWTVYAMKLRERNQITPEMTVEEKEDALKRRRREKIIGRVAAGAVALGLAYMMYKQVSADSLPDTSTSPELPTDGLSGTDQDLSVEPGDIGLGGEADDIPDLSEAAAEFIPDPAFEVPDGGGGERLFNALDINPREWYNIQFDLLDRFPDSFYRMDDGNVGISRPGMLPQEVQEYINSRFN